MIHEASTIENSIIGASMAQALCADDKEAPKDKSMAHWARHWLSPNGASMAHDGAKRPRTVTTVTNWLGKEEEVGDVFLPLILSGLGRSGQRTPLRGRPVRPLSVLEAWPGQFTCPPRCPPCPPCPPY